MDPNEQLALLQEEKTKSSFLINPEEEETEEPVE